MKLPDSWQRVTPLSKALAMILFVILPFLGFYLGIKYQQNIDPKEIYVTKKVPVKRQDTYRDLIQRCGPLSQITPVREHFDALDGPVWAPDCRHAAWSLWVSGTGWLGDDAIDSRPTYKGPQPKEGLFIYDDRTQKIAKVLEDESILSRVQVTGGLK